MSSLKIERVVKEHFFSEIASSAKASVFAQASKMGDLRSTHFSDTAKNAASQLSGVSIHHARTPGFFKFIESASILGFVTGKKPEATEAFHTVNRRSSSLSTVSDDGVRAGAKMGLRYSILSGSTPLDKPSQDKMSIVTRFLHQSLKEYREVYASLQGCAVAEREGLRLRLFTASEDVISDSETYLNARNDIASCGYDVTSFDKNVEDNSLLVIAVRAYELDPIREKLFPQKAAKPTMTAFSLSTS